MAILFQCYQIIIFLIKIINYFFKVIFLHFSNLILQLFHLEIIIKFTLIIFIQNCWIFIKGNYLNFLHPQILYINFSFNFLLLTQILINFFNILLSF